jgi:UPF0716 protein FxsA
MALLVLALLIGVPLIEIALFIEVGGWIGLWPTIATVVATALIGTSLLRRQGLATLQRAQAEMAAQRMPVRELFDGACLLVAGVLLLTPGFLTDAIGFVLLIPPLRSTIGLWVWQALQKRGSIHVRSTGFGTGEPGAAGRGGPGGPVIDGEYEDLSPENAANDARRLPEREADIIPPENGDQGATDSPWRRNED